MSSLQPWPIFAFALSVTLPIFIMAAAGAVIKRAGIIDEAFVGGASKLVFNVGLPVTLFFSAARADLSHLVNSSLIAVLSISTIAIFAMAWLSACWLIKNKSDRGVYVQGAFRGNLLIIGLAFCANAYGEEGLAIATVPVGILIILYNVLSVYILHVSSDDGTTTGPAATMLGIVRNPLIIGIAAGLAVNAAGVSLPPLVLDVGGYFSGMTLPLALLCIGASMDLSALKASGGSAFGSSLWKLIGSPVTACLIAFAWGVQGRELGIVFLLAAAPTAAASFMMARAMGGNASLAANIVVLATLGSLLTVTGGLILLKALSLI